MTDELPGMHWHGLVPWWRTGLEKNIKLQQLVLAAETRGLAKRYPDRFHGGDVYRNPICLCCLE